jgi:SAM-dependent methyltransferase
VEYTLPGTSRGEHGPVGIHDGRIRCPRPGGGVTSDGRDDPVNRRRKGCVEQTERISDRGQHYRGNLSSNGRIAHNSGRARARRQKDVYGLAYGGRVTLRDSMEPERWRARASSFGPAADLYDRARPTYPVEAVAWGLDPLGPGRWRIADIGAGTGIMTRVLVGLDQDVVAIEPDELMREQLMVTTPDAEAVPGSAEDLPLADGDLDAAVAAQSYHWFEPHRAHLELGRVIRPGGVFVAIWNERDESAPWVKAYSITIEGDRGPNDVPRDEDHELSFGELFGPAEMRLFHHSVATTPDSLIALMRSRSYYITATPQRQSELEEQVRELARAHPDLAGRTEFPLPYVTRVFRAVRRR